MSGSPARLAAGAAVFVAIVALGFASSRSEDIVGTTSALTYVALGDSVASGHGLGTNAAPVPADRSFGQPQGNCQRSSGRSTAEEAYTDVVRHELETRITGGVKFFKLACTGHTTTDVLTYQLPAAERVLGDGAAVVTLTVGANDYQFSDPHTYASLLDPRVEAYTAWRSAIEERVRTEIGAALDRLGRHHANRRILVTHYFNPFNDESIVYSLVPLCNGTGPANLAVDCAARVSDSLAGLNRIISEAVATYRALPQPGDASVAVVDGVQVAFEGHEAPSPNCGRLPPTVEQSWIQVPPRPLLLQAVLGQQRLGTGDDCFHPNVTGHRMLARLVLARLDSVGRLGFP